MKKALIIVDMGKDFLPGGTLPVAGSDEIVAPIVARAGEFDLVVATRDLHPENHISFSEDPQYEDMSWPAHCVNGTDGAMLHPEISEIADVIVSKGMNPEEEAYSGFAGDPDLEALLDEHEITHVTIVGVAIEKCVKATALDAEDRDFHTTVELDSARGLDPKTTAEAIEEMRTWLIHINPAEAEASA